MPNRVDLEVVLVRFKRSPLFPQDVLSDSVRIKELQSYSTCQQSRRFESQCTSWVTHTRSYNCYVKLNFREDGRPETREIVFLLIFVFFQFILLSDQYQRPDVRLSTVLRINVHLFVPNTSQHIVYFYNFYILLVQKWLRQQTTTFTEVLWVIDYVILDVWYPLSFLGFVIVTPNREYHVRKTPIQLENTPFSLGRL